MTPIEALLLLADLLTFVALAVRLPAAMGWIHHAAPIALLLALTQALVEGPRWQMAPAYVLTAIFVLIWLSQKRKPTGGEQKPIHRLVAGIAIGLGGVTLAFAALLPLAFPVFRFPPPTGPYAIGTLTYHWVDASRPEIFTADPNDYRELMVQVWYPAGANTSAHYAPYMPDADVVTGSFARLQRMPEFIFGHFKYVTTNAVSAAPAADDHARYPVLLFLEGATGFRQMNTFQIEELVSRGYVVVALDQPGAAADVVFPDGRQIAALPIAQLMGVIRPSYLPGMPSPLLNGRALEGSVVPYLTQDVAFTLDRLAAVNEADPNGILTGRLDLQHVGAFGFSLGGIVVGEACRHEVRLRACLMIDAPMPIDVVEAGLRRPVMWITRPAASMRLERQRSGGWPEAEIDAHQTSMRAVYQNLPGAGYFVQIPGAFHSNFMDVPNWSPLASQFGVTGPIDGQRAHVIINAYSVAFFDQHLKGRPENLLMRSSTQYPEALFEARRH